MLEKLAVAKKLLASHDLGDAYSKATRVDPSVHPEDYEVSFRVSG